MICLSLTFCSFVPCLLPVQPRRCHPVSPTARDAKRQKKGENMGYFPPRFSPSTEHAGARIPSYKVPRSTARSAKSLVAYLLRK